MPSIEDLASQLSSNDQAAVYRAKKELTETTAAAGVPGKADQRRELAATLAKAITAKNGDALKYDVKARAELARALSAVAGDMEVPVLKEALNDFDAREMARFALDRMNCQAATDALADAALNAIGVEFRIGAINALGRRTGSQVVDVLKACVGGGDSGSSDSGSSDSGSSDSGSGGPGSSDPEIRLAAAEALANHADASADRFLIEAAKHTGERGRLRSAKARIRLAAKLASAGRKADARHIFQSLAQSDTTPPAQKKAAGNGLAQLG